MSSSSKKSQTGSPIESPAMSECFSKEQEKFLPIANVNRIMKKSLPGNAKISKEAKETVQECVSEFISFITGEASDKCHREKRKTINGDDLLWAMTTLGFESYVGPLKAYLNKYREIEGEKSQMSRQDQNQNQSPKTNSTNATKSNNDIIVSVGKEYNNISHLHVTNKLDFQEFNNNGVLYSLCGQVNNPNSYEEVSRNNNMVNIGYGESNSYGNNVGTNFSVDGIGNASRAMASHLQHGIGW